MLPKLSKVVVMGSMHPINPIDAVRVPPPARAVPPGANADTPPSIRGLLATAATCWLTACAGLPDLPPAHPWQGDEPAAAASGQADVAWPLATVWDSWADPELQDLLATAARRQPSLLQVRSRLAQAQAAADAAGAARLPQVNAAVDLSDQRFTENGLVPPPVAGRTFWNNSVQLSVSWEWDLFGRQQAALAAAVGQLRAASAEAQAAAVLLASNVAAGWVTLARTVESHDITEAALDQRRRVLALVRQRIAAGLDTTVELRQAEGAIAQALVELEAADEQIARARHALAELSGQRPDALDGGGAGSPPVPATPAAWPPGVAARTAITAPAATAPLAGAVPKPLSPRLAGVRQVPLPAGLPADLLGRRADLVAQRWRVEAATQDVAAARAQFYPNVNLVAFAGLSSLGLDRLLRAGSVTYGIGPALRLPVFDGGRLRASLRSRAAEVDVAVEGYNAALLRALREVADEVASLQSIERQQRAQEQALAAAESAFDLAGQRYGAGLGNFLVVLTAEANVLAQRRGAVELKARHLTAEVALSRALGGGWHDLDGGPVPAPVSQRPAAAIATADRSPSSDVPRTIR